MKRHHALVLFVCAAILLSGAAAQAFNNPIRTPGQDPSVVYYNGAYYMAQSDGRINVIRSTTLAGLGSGTSVTVWTAPAGPPGPRPSWRAGVAPTPESSGGYGGKAPGSAAVRGSGDTARASSPPDAARSAGTRRTPDTGRAR